MTVCVCVCSRPSEVVPRSKALPVRLFLSSKSGNSCIADLLVTEELARFNQG